MHIIIGYHNGYIRIRGRGFTTYVDSLSSFRGITQALNVTSYDFDESVYASLKNTLVKYL